MMCCTCRPPCWSSSQKFWFLSHKTHNAQLYFIYCFFCTWSPVISGSSAFCDVLLYLRFGWFGYGLYWTILDPCGENKWSRSDSLNSVTVMWCYKWYQSIFIYPEVTAETYSSRHFFHMNVFTRLCEKTLHKK